MSVRVGRDSVRRKSEPDIDPLVSFSLPIELGRKLTIAWAKFEEREQVRMDPHKQVELRIERQIVAHVGALLAGPSRVTAYEASGVAVSCVQISGPALCWVRIVNWCCREAWRSRNPRELREFCASLGLLVVTKISPLLSAGRGVEDIEHEGDA